MREAGINNTDTEFTAEEESGAGKQQRQNTRHSFFFFFLHHNHPSLNIHTSIKPWQRNWLCMLCKAFVVPFSVVRGKKTQSVLRRTQIWLSESRKYKFVFVAFSLTSLETSLSERRQQEARRKHMFSLLAADFSSSWFQSWFKTFNKSFYHHKERNTTNGSHSSLSLVLTDRLVIQRRWIIWTNSSVYKEGAGWCLKVFRDTRLST